MSLARKVRRQAQRAVDRALPLAPEDLRPAMGIPAGFWRVLLARHPQLARRVAQAEEHGEGLSDVDHDALLAALQSLRTDPLLLSLARDQHVEAAESDMLLLEEYASLLVAGPTAESERLAFEAEFADVVQLSRDAAPLFEDILAEKRTLPPDSGKADAAT